MVFYANEALKMKTVKIRLFYSEVSLALQGDACLVSPRLLLAGDSSSELEETCADLNYGRRYFQNESFFGSVFRKNIDDLQRS